MKCDIVAAGVGGQGVLSLSAIIAQSALRAGLHVQQSEVHGMSQRGGAVFSHLRLSDIPIHSAIIPKGQADLILSMEPVESLRYLDYLTGDGTLLSATEPVVNIPDYPEIEGVLDDLRSLPRVVLVDADRLAREAGNAKAANMVMVGAALHLLPVGEEEILEYIEATFGPKGEKLVRINRKAFAAGREAVGCAAV